jgi:hypothetical protein
VLFSRERDLTGELLQELSKCSAAELAKMFGCGPAPATPDRQDGGRATVGLDGEIASTMITPAASGPNFGNDIPTGSLCYNTFLPFLGQTADGRAFQPVVFLG